METSDELDESIESSKQFTFLVDPNIGEGIVDVECDSGNEIELIEIASGGNLQCWLGMALERLGMIMLLHKRRHFKTKM